MIDLNRIGDVVSTLGEFAKRAGSDLAAPEGMRRIVGARSLAESYGRSSIGNDVPETGQARQGTVTIELVDLVPDVDVDDDGVYLSVEVIEEHRDDVQEVRACNGYLPSG